MVFTAYDTDERILGALRAGAREYLKGFFAGGDLRRRTHGLRSRLALQPGVTARAEHLARRRARTGQPAHPQGAEVLGLISEGLQNSEIAERLFVTERTVKFHVSSILAKLGADNRIEAVDIAARRGLIRMPG